MIGIGISKDNTYHNAVKRPPSTLYFDGVDDSIAIPKISAYDLTNALTVVQRIWVDSTAFDDWRLSLIKGSSSQLGTGDFCYAIRTLPDGTIAFNVYDTAWRSVSKQVPKTNAWFHIAMTVGSNVLKGFIDGVNVGSTSVPSNLRVNSTNFNIGGLGGDLWKGKIGSTRIYNRELSETEINQLMNGYHIEQGLVGYWKLDEGAGRTVRDLSTNKNNGTISGATWKY